MTGVQLLAQRLLDGDRRALARAITMVEDGHPACGELLSVVFPRSGGATTLGITGPPGVGKSTLIDMLIRTERERARSVAVLSVDPSSPFTAGAILGDRLRMSRHFTDPEVFIRSMGSRKATGGLAKGTGQAAALADAAGSEVVMIETVGVGQVEIDIAKSTDSVVLVLMAGAGDSIQALKSGIMEIPDVIVINRADDPRAAGTLRHVREALSLRPKATWKPPILLTEASTGRGLEDLRWALDAHREHLVADGRLAERRRQVAKNQIADMVTTEMAARVEEAFRTGGHIDSFVEDVAARRLDPLTVAREIADRLTRSAR